MASDSGGSGGASARKPRLLFCSYHSYSDLSNGAALATRDLLGLLASRGWPCQVFCGPQLDFEEETPVTALLDRQGLAYQVRSYPQGPAPFRLLRDAQGGIPITLYTPSVGYGDGAAGPPTPEPTREEGTAYLALLGRVLARFRPELFLTYGGQWVAREALRGARRYGARVVAAVHNLAYHAAGYFRDADAVLVPSHFAQAYYRRLLGLESTAIPGP